MPLLIISVHQYSVHFRKYLLISNNLSAYETIITSTMTLLFAPLLLLGFLFNLVPMSFAANSFILTYTYNNNGINDVYTQEGTILDTCTCNATACKIVTADDTSNSEIVLTTNVYPNPSGCTGFPITSAKTVPTLDTADVPCGDGSVPATLTAAISSSTAYSSLAAAVSFAYSSLDDCNNGVYESYVARVYATCGDILTSMCNLNVSSYAQSASLYTETEYFNSACDTVHVTETISVPTTCTPPNNDDDFSTDDAHFYRNYQTVLLQGPYVSASSNTYAVPKGAYVALIVMVFVAFILGVAISFGYVKYSTGSASDQKTRLTERLTESGAAKSTDVL
jgi:hypothetical protein